MDANIDHQQVPQPGHVSLTRVSAKEFAAKFKSKRECYNFLAGECEVYLPPYDKSFFTRPFKLRTLIPSILYFQIM